jgi:hypothetical protein
MFRLINAQRSFTVLMKKIREKKPSLGKKSGQCSSSHAIMSTFRNTTLNKLNKYPDLDSSLTNLTDLVLLSHHVLARPRNHWSRTAKTMNEPFISPRFSFSKQAKSHTTVADLCNLAFGRVR